MQIKTINDYLDQLQLIYPEISREDIKRAVQYGWKQFYIINNFGADVCIEDHSSGLWCYVGALTFDTFKHCQYYIDKLVTKIRIMTKRRKIPWDGYYYFALNDEQWDDYQKQIHKRGRPKKLFHYGKVKLYKLLNECEIRNCDKKYIFRVPMLSECSSLIKKDDFVSKYAELIITRPPQKFKDILISNKKYDYGSN